MEPGASSGTGTGSGASRVPDGQLETARRGGQEAAPHRVRRKLLPPAPPAPQARASRAPGGGGSLQGASEGAAPAAAGELRSRRRGALGGARPPSGNPSARRAPHPRRPHLRLFPWVHQAGIQSFPCRPVTLQGS